MKIGLIGCGNISDVYIKNCKRFDMLNLVACADLDRERARSKAEVYDVPRSASVDEVLADPEIELILNLTPPQAHFEVSLRAIEAGKHVYSEKPLALHRDEGRRLMDAAQSRRVRLGCAPDTFMGGALQTARRVLDAGEVAVANGWVSIEGLSLPVTEGSYYWLAFNLQGQNVVSYQNGQPSRSHYWLKNTSYGALPGQFNVSRAGYNNNAYVMRATVDLEE